MYSFDKRSLPAQQGVHKLCRWVLRSAMARLSMYELLNGGLRHSVAGKSVCKLRKGGLHPSETYKCVCSLCKRYLRLKKALQSLRRFAIVVCVSQRLRKECVGSQSLFVSRKDSGSSLCRKNRQLVCRFIKAQVVKGRDVASKSTKLNMRLINVVL